MRLMINHQTHYVYTDVVNRSIQYIKMTPSTNAHQQVQNWDVSVPGQRDMQLDTFGNVVDHNAARTLSANDHYGAGHRRDEFEFK